MLDGPFAWAWLVVDPSNRITLCHALSADMDRCHSLPTMIARLVGVMALRMYHIRHTSSPHT